MSLQFLQRMVEGINANQGTVNCAHCAERFNDHIAVCENTTQISLGPVPTSSAELYLKPQIKLNKITQSSTDDSRIIQRCVNPDNVKMICDLNDETIRYHIDLTQEETSPQRARFVPTNALDIKQCLLAQARRKKDGTAYGFVILTQKARGGLIGGGHLINYYVSADNQVYFIDAQRTHVNEQIVQQLDMDGYVDEIFYIQSIPPEGYRIKNEVSPAPVVLIKTEVNVNRGALSSESSTSNQPSEPNNTIMLRYWAVTQLNDPTMYSVNSNINILLNRESSYPQYNNSYDHIEIGLHYAQCKDWSKAYHYLQLGLSKCFSIQGSYCLGLMVMGGFGGAPRDATHGVSYFVDVVNKNPKHIGAWDILLKLINGNFYTIDAELAKLIKENIDRLKSGGSPILSLHELKSVSVKHTKGFKPRKSDTPSAPFFMEVFSKDYDGDEDIEVARLEARKQLSAKDWLNLGIRQICQLRTGKSVEDAVKCFEKAQEAYNFMSKDARILLLEYQKILYCQGLTADFQISKARSYLRDKRRAQYVASESYYDLLETNFNVPGFWLRAKEFIDSKLGCFREIGNAELAAACQLNYDRLMRGESALPIAHEMGIIDKNQYQNVSTSIRSAVELPQQVVDYQNASTSTRSAVQTQPEIDYQNASTSTRLTPAVPPVIFTPLPRSTSSEPTAANHKRHHEDAVDDRVLAALDEQIAEQTSKLQKIQESRNILLAKKMKPN